jgi:peptidyl-prolyl cis-trans isomerase B (cyclophilin B)
MDVVRKIAEVKTGNRAGHQDVPQEEILINSATVI